MSFEGGRLCRGEIILVGSIIENVHVLAAVNSNSWATVIVCNVVINLDSSFIAGGLVAINNNPLTVSNLTGLVWYLLHI